jgi:hypothetical protein
LTASVAGWIAIAAGVVAVIGLVIALVLHLRLRRVRAAQLTLQGSGGGDLVDFAVSLQGRVDGLHRAVDDVTAQLGRLERRLDATVSRLAVVRYDAYENTGGHQSASIAQRRRPQRDPGAGLRADLHQGARRRSRGRFSLAGGAGSGREGDEVAAVAAFRAATFRPGCSTFLS